MKNEKIITKTFFKSIRENLCKSGEKIILSHGVFDLLHPGHIEHLQEAKALGDILVVSVTAKKYVNKGPGRPFFSDEQRMKTLSALSCVDYVILSEDITVINVLDVIKPDLYVKGDEYKKFDDDITQNIEKEVNKVREYGGDIYYTSGERFSSTKLLNNCFPMLPDTALEYSKEFIKKYSFNDINSYIEEFSNLKVMIVGDIIIDEYVFCDIQGLMSKDRGFSAKYLGKEIYLGGVLAISKHISEFVQKATVCGILGTNSNIHSMILNDLSSKLLLDLQFDPNFTTTVKRRFIERRGKRNEYDKLFSINYLHDEEYDKRSEKRVDREKFYNRLYNKIKEYDLVILADYGHGLIDDKAMEIIQENADTLSINCQTNSTNYGTNIITKYKKADYFTLDQRELNLAFGTGSKDYHNLLVDLKEKLGCKSGWLTVGSMGAIGIDNEDRLTSCPALTLTVQDTIGAGDAFFAIASLCGKQGVPIEVSTFLANTAGAKATSYLGNSQAIKKIDFLKYISTLMNV
jgi:rfaE bifunctional protein nucleotidyltransferase chain/domain